MSLPLTGSGPKCRAFLEPCRPRPSWDHPSDKETLAQICPVLSGFQFDTLLRESLHESPNIPTYCKTSFGGTDVLPRANSVYVQVPYIQFKL